MYKKCEEILNKLQSEGKIKITNFQFPQKQLLKLKLKDLLEDEVDEKYYLSDKMIQYIIDNNEKWTGNNNKSIVNKSIASTINTGEGQRRCDASNYIVNSQENDIDIKEVVRKYGIFDTDKSTHQAGSVYDVNGLSPTLDTMQGGYRQPCIEIDNTRSSNESVKRIKQNIIKGDVANTLTANAMQSFNHNNCALIEENYVTKKYQEFIDKNGYIPEMYNPYNNAEIKNITPTQSIQGGSTTSSATVLIKNATKQGYLEAKDGDGVYISNIDKKRGTVQKEMIPTLKTSPDIGVVINPLKGVTDKSWQFEQQVYDSEGITRTLKAGGGSGNIPKVIIGSTQEHAAVSTNGIVPTLTSSMETGGGHVPMHNYDLRIRKLTPKECFRLMNFDDKDFEKAKNVPTSNTQLYKMAGNSIVVGVLEAIFKELLKDYIPNNKWSDLD